jgi:hypothetical protein
MRTLSLFTAVAVCLAAARAHAQTPPAVDVPGPEPKVTVILDEPGETLMSQNAFGAGQVCRSPCAARLPRHGSYRVELIGSRGTDELELAGSPPKVRLRLQPPSSGALVGGSILTYAGFSILPSGLLLLMLGSFMGGRDTKIAGAVITGVGAVSLGIGLPLLLTNRYSGVEQQPVARGLSLVRHF